MCAVEPSTDSALGSAARLTFADAIPALTLICFAVGAELGLGGNGDWAWDFNAETVDGTVLAAAGHTPGPPRGLDLPAGNPEGLLFEVVPSSRADAAEYIHLTISFAIPQDLSAADAVLLFAPVAARPGGKAEAADAPVARMPYGVTGIPYFDFSRGTCTADGWTCDGVTRYVTLAPVDRYAAFGAVEVVLRDVRRARSLEGFGR